MLEQIDASYIPVGASTPISNLYDRDGGSWAVDRSLFLGADNTIGCKDIIQVYRTAPKRTATSNGAAKGALKMSREVSVPGVNSDITLLDLNIFNLDTRIPAGLTETEFKNALRSFISVVSNEALMVSVLFKQQI